MTVPFVTAGSAPLYSNALLRAYITALSNEPHLILLPVSCSPSSGVS